MRPEYLTREVTINRDGLETLLKRALLDTAFPGEPEARAITGAEFSVIVNRVLSYMEDAMFSSDRDGGEP